MSGSLEEAYVAVERAYGQGDFAGALQLATTLQPQVPPGRPDLLDQRLQLLLGHIHLYGLNQPDLATAAYTAVLEGCTEPSYRELAAQGLQISRQQMPVATEPEPATEPNPVASAPVAAAAEPIATTANAGQALPATPWLNQLQDPQQALQQIQQAWATATPAQVAAPAAASAVSTGGAATPWQPGGAEAAAPEMPTSAGADAMDAAPMETAPEPEAVVVEAAAATPEGSGLVVQGVAETGEDEPADPQAIIPVVVTVEEEAAAAEATAETAAPPEAAAEPEAPEPAAPSFSEEEWADFQRGMLLVELTTSNAGPTR